jgi:pimeloyl-ACP methyl ester carboxylesterase
MTATVLLVHGAFHGAWCWERVVRGLAARGVAHRAIDLPGRGRSAMPLGSILDNGKAVQEAIASIEGPVVACGHSLGGAAITEGGLDPRVRHLVYLAALVPDVGEPITDVLGSAGVDEMMKSLRPAEDGTATIERKRAEQMFYQDCDAESVSWACERLCAERLETIGATVARAAWRDVPSTYVLCEDDRAISPADQERLAARCSDVVRWPTGHSPMLTRPEALADLLAALAR